MGDRQPVSTLEDLAAMDEDEMLEGYRDGLADEPEPGDNRSRAYWHGWRNGMSDKGRRAIDDAQRKLARATVARWKERDHAT